MKQYYTIHEYEKFLALFHAKNEPSDIEKDFLDKTYKYIKYIKWIPGLLFIGVGNSIAMNSATNDSDIDLYIVTEKKRMWLVRICITTIFQLLGIRKNSKYHAGRFCLSFFSTKEGMDFSKFALEKDPYLYFWVLTMKPILSYNNSYGAFLDANRSWMKYDNFNSLINENIKYIKIKGQKKEYFGFIWNRLNSLCKSIFLPKTLASYDKIGRPYGVIINDDLLKFHNGDIRKEIADKI